MGGVGVGGIGDRDEHWAAVLFMLVERPSMRLASRLKPGRREVDSDDAGASPVEAKVAVGAVVLERV